MGTSERTMMFTLSKMNSTHHIPASKFTIRDLLFSITSTKGGVIQYAVSIITETADVIICRHNRMSTLSFALVRAVQVKC
jgi:hypothetical protein